MKFRVSGMTCTACPSIIKNILTSSDRLKSAISDVSVTYPIGDMLLTLHSDSPLTKDHIKDIVYDELNSMYGCEFIPDTTTTDTFKPAIKPATDYSLYKHYLMGFIGVGCGLTLLIISAVGLSIPFAGMVAIAAIGTAISLILSKDIFIKAWKSFYKTKKLTMDALFSISTLIALTVSFLSFFFSLHMMIDAALLILGGRHLGIAFKKSAEQSVLHNLALSERLPRFVYVEEKDSTPNEPRLVRKSVNELQPGDIIRVRKESYIPVDGECLSEAEVITLWETGDPNSTAKKSGDIVRQGHRINNTGAGDFLRIKVTHTKENSFLAKIDDYNATARNNKLPVEFFAEKALHYFVPAVFICALAAGLAIGLCGAFPPLVAVHCAIAIALAACPCTFGVIIPLVRWIYIAKLDDIGVRVNNPQIIAEASGIQHAVLDLTGTLTKSPSVEKILISSDAQGEGEAALTPHHILELLRAIEEDVVKEGDKTGARNLFAMAIHQHAVKTNTSSGTKLTVTTEGKKNHAGRRVQLSDGHWYTIGNSTMMQEYSIDTCHLDKKHHHQDGEHIIYLACDNVAVGLIVCASALRDDAKLLVNKLRARNIEVHLCTGASKEATAPYAKALGIPDTHLQTNCMPVPDVNHAKIPDKASYVKKLQANGKKVLMIGDAANDTGAMAQANVSIAVESSTSPDTKIAKQANVVICNQSLLSILNVLDISTSANNNADQNLGVSIIYNVGAISIILALSLAFAFTLNPGFCALLMIAQAGFVFANLYRFKCQSVTDYAKEVTKPALSMSTTATLNSHKITFTCTNEPILSPIVQTAALITDSTIVSRPAHDMVIPVGSFSISTPTTLRAS